MSADFDLSKLDDIPDVVPAAGRDAAPPPVAPRASSRIAGPSRAELRGRRWIVLGVALAWLAGHLGVLAIRADFAKLGALYVLLQVALPAVLGAVSLGVALSPGRDGLGVGVGLARAVALASVAGMTLLTAAMPLPFPYVPPPGLTFGQWVIICGDIIAVMAAVPLVLAGVVLRRSFVAASMERSAAVGAACALAAVTTMHLHCENIQVGHMLLGHMVPAAAITVLAALVLRSVTRA